MTETIFHTDVFRDALPPALREAFTVRYLTETDSTNRRAKAAAADGAAEGTVIAALRQTAGRGRMGRSFYSPEGTGLYMSLLLRPALPPVHAGRITTAAAVAVCRAADRLGVPGTQIKWVNDIFLGGRKICGILTESALTEDGRFAYAVLGIGINLAPPCGGFPPELAPIAGTLLDAPLPFLRERMMAAVLTEFAPLYRTLAEGAPMAEYERRCLLIGEDVSIYGSADAEAPIGVGRVLGVDSECGLRIRRPDGREETLSSGEVRVRQRQPE